jgi:2-amino-4-hydroxy-6-hydroxymethyldihydropteridine diphosphokinase
MPIKKRLTRQYTLMTTKHYPCSRIFTGEKRVLLGIGGNIGDVLRRFTHLFHYFNRSSFVDIIQTAAILKNPAFGYTEQDDFYNSLLWIETRLTPKALLAYLLRVEKKFGRKRSFANAPRTLDIDMIMYENVMIDTKVLTLPHPAWQTRDSVLIPLSYMGA